MYGILETVICVQNNVNAIVMSFTVAAGADICRNDKILLLNIHLSNAL